MKRISLIDLGSNSVRFVVTDILDSGSYRLVYQQKESVRLSEGMWATQNLTEAGMSRTLDALKTMASISTSMGCEEIYAVATAAVRMANNGNDFIRRVKEDTGISIRCISGVDEAYLGFLGVVNTIGLENFILFDLGGASIELSLVRDRRLVKSVSLPMGALTLTGQFLQRRRNNPEAHDEMIRHIQDFLYREDWLKGQGLPLIGIGGTARNIGKIDQRSKDYPISLLHNYKVKDRRFEEIFQMLQGKTVEQLKKIPGLSVERADIITAGVTLIRELMKFTKAPSMTVSGSGLREGLFFKYYGMHYGYENGVLPNIIEQSTQNKLLGMNEADVSHARYVAKLASFFFDEWSMLLGTNERHRILVRVAALLHDIGKQVNYYSHAKHSAYMIIHSSLYGLSHREQAMAGFMAAYSHGFNGRYLRQSPFSSILKNGDKETIQKLSFVVALAEALDESHDQCIRDVQTYVEEDRIHVTIWLKAGGNMSILQGAVEKLKKQCKKDFRRELYIQWRQEE